MSKSNGKPDISQDAAIVLGLASTALPLAITAEDEAERWLRILRLHGQVGRALQAIGVGEAPLETPAQPRTRRVLLHQFPRGDEAVRRVCRRACHFAAERDADAVTTADILFAVLELYDRAFDRALYVRGGTREELLERLATQTDPGNGQSDSPKVRAGAAKLPA